MPRRDGPQFAAANFSGRLAGGRVMVALLVPILLVTSVALVRASGLTSRPRVALPGAAANMTPAELVVAAADAFELATATGGAGYTFEISQTGTLVAKPGGPLIEGPDPDDPGSTVETTSQVVGTYLERGTETPAGFHAEIRRGPTDPRAPPDWDGASLELAALVRDERTYRNDGAGWYVTDHPPGLGLDPATAALLPTMLRGLDDLQDAAGPQPEPSTSPEPGATADPFAGVAAARRLTGVTTVADMPGIIAVDLAPATELRGPAELAFDDAGRLVGLRVVARNTHLDRHDMLIDTVITFAYPGAAPALPDAQPVWTPPSPPADGE